MKKILMSILTFVVICLTLWFQSSFLNELPLAGVFANIGIVLVAGLGLISGDIVGGIVGLVYGLLFDISFGRTIGIYMGLYSAVGIIAGILNNRFSKEKISLVMLVFGATVAFETLAYFINVVINKFDFDFLVLAITLILECAYNMLLAILFYKVVFVLGENINSSENRII